MICWTERGGGFLFQSARLIVSVRATLQFDEISPCFGPMIRFTMFGIPVEIQPWFWVILALLGSNFGQDLGAANQALNIALFVIAGGFSILVHELGHALVGRHFRARPYIVLHGFGGYAAFPGSHFSRWQSFFVTAAGPCIQLLLGVCVFLWSHRATGLTEAFRGFLDDLWLVSIFWALLNLIPVFPLDGGQMLAAAMGPRRRRMMLQISIGIAVMGALWLWTTGIGVMMPIFLLFFAWQNYQELRQSRW
jgi:Zn-dependent protease